MADRKTGEVLYVRVPEGTKERVDAVRGRERQSDWTRRTLLAALEAEEASRLPSTNRQTKRRKNDKTPSSDRTTDE